MRTSRRILACVVSLFFGVSFGLLCVGPASAETSGERGVTQRANGSITFAGDPGDYITGGESWSYDTNKNDGLTVTATPQYFGLRITGHDGKWWHLDMSAPTGKTLVPGTYLDAHRHPFHGTGPGLSLGGDGRGCNELTGQFTVTKIVWGPHNYLQEFDATFEQHCEGGKAAARGTIHIANPQAPDELALGIGVSTTGKAVTVNGKAVLDGVVTCTAAVEITISGTLTQVRDDFINKGGYSTKVSCVPGRENDWTAEADSHTARPFQPGRAEARSSATAKDPTYDVSVTATDTTSVRLTRA